MVLLLCRLKTSQRYMVEFIPIKLAKGGEIVRAICYRKTVPLRKMLLNIKTCGNEWSNFSENQRVVAIKLLELT